MKFLVVVLVACVAVVSCQQELQREKRGYLGLGAGLLAAPAVAAPAVVAAAPAVVAAPAAVGYGYGYLGGVHGRLVHG
ncbi:uncharacterized protein LOC126092197 isoform X7 [Schistocerca cancellata]|uniref:uncharacterized protein LOC126092197 isoform X4 n=1 Tax=Schistocerca cancellata TaxID=274614 RepID=UPI00211870D0|nr:uncharacterized protein LOC126092197 isoform X4 [Schistocerca cancellata]XP_049763642.1 uncharacterized protein LOC126092197 isoform X5 [Schistocerca cancellata]XP_049763643.1 uncharacterized protein LOC126092197 isoform X6 [Schistocerca cancellata]XP_049763644.1 uncharacterized protein LOC126092197 isoform X7 [Schistocerca cancellata]